MPNRPPSNDIANRYLDALSLTRGHADLNFLARLNQRHVAILPFSSIGPLLGNELPLDCVSLFERIAVKRRGGYCFEQNGLMYEVLRELGFTVRFYLARVIYNKDIHPGLTHRITLVEINGSQYVVDVGFGPLGPYLPVNMSGEISREKRREFWITEVEPGVFHMQTRKDGKPYSLYKFELNRYGHADCEVGHFYSHKHPKASFTNHLVVSIITDQAVRSIRNHEFRIEDGSSEKSFPIRDDKDLKNILTEHFNIEVTDTEAHQLFSKTADKR